MTFDVYRGRKTTQQQQQLENDVCCYDECRYKEADYIWKGTRTRYVRTLLKGVGEVVEGDLKYFAEEISRKS